ncbi:MAG: SDR family oxidoreductase [Candidatus Promineifilaceae bacterium]
MTRLLITGGSSYLGRHLVPLAAPNFQIGYTYFTGDPLPAAGGRQLNVLDREAVHELFQQLQPEVVIHTIRSNRVPEMETVITVGALNVSAAAQAIGARLVHVSTDVVFDGQHGPYTEEAPVSPIHAYGRAKVEAEQIVAAHRDHVIVRTSLIYGLHTMDRGTAWIVETLAANKPVTLFTDQLRNPVWVESLSLACLELAGNEHVGILNIAGGQALTRAEFGLRMLDWWGITDRNSLRFGQSDAARWPRDCRLDLSRARAILSTPLPGVDEVLRAHRVT